MKKFTLLFSITLLVLIGFKQAAFAQAQRLVLVEEFTQASCPPCASQNPAFDDLLLSNTDKVVTLKYHTSWPGVDPMNAQQPGDVQTRVDYYSVNGVPTGIMDGDKWPDYDGYINLSDQYLGAPYQCTQGLIDSMYAISTPFNLSSTYWFSQNLDSIYATVTITAVGSYSGSLVGQVAVIEKVVSFNTPPGTNGETVFDAVAKKMLPNASGTTLASSWNSGDTYSYTVGWKLSNIYDMNQIAVVAFIQNNTSKQVMQSAYSQPQQFSNYGGVTSVTGVSVVQCTDQVNATAVIQNYGSQNLTSATIEYKIDGGAAQDFSWSGNLANGATENVTLPAITLAPGSHTIEAYISSANGTINPRALNNDQFKNVAVLMLPGAPAPIVQDFTTATFPPSGWVLSSTDPANTWKRVSTVGGYQTGLGSTEFPFYVVAAGSVDDLYVQNFDFSDNNQQLANLEFDYAKAKYTGFTDRLKVLASSDCGVTWTTLFDKSDANGLSSVTSTADWKPTLSTQWKTQVCDMSQFIGETNVLVKFEAISGYGNNLYIDNVNIHYGAPVGIAIPETSPTMIYPNPANDIAVIHVGGILSNQTMLEVVNVLGEVIYSTPAKSNSDIDINTLNFETGMYIYRLNDDGKIVAQDKFNVSH
ncbi:MAG TPA: T9SS type A sorting domain-containing protein [Chitinophagales bacterium]|nr:T9SS type A sorting domain-containing protein [Chitinophagales bacterium]